MVTRRRDGVILIEAIVAIGLLAVMVTVFAAAQHTERRALLTQYRRAVAMSIVDGEMEVLAAGEWRAWDEGQHPYPVRVEAARNLPEGVFTLTRRAKSVQLAWRPARGAPIAREATLP